MAAFSSPRTIPELLHLIKTVYTIMKRKRIAKILVIILICFFSNSCVVIYHKSKLHLANELFDYNAINFRTDGYYYMIKEYAPGKVLLENGKVNNHHKTCGITPIIFYNNGFVRKAGFTQGLKSYKDKKEKEKNIELALKKLEKDIVNDSFHVKIENTIWDWGLYNQYDNGRILIQSYINHFGDYRLIDWTGVVRNDSIIILTSKYGYKAHNKPQVIDEEIYELYRFRKFSHKPDSINYIMNNRNKFGNK